MNRENNLKTFIVRCGEVALKGKNKPYFERVLVERIRRALGEPRDISVKRQEGLIFIKAPESCDEEDIIKKVRKVFGIASISPAVEAESDLDSIGEAAVLFMLKQIEKRGIKTFKVETNRADKNFPAKSPEISRIMPSSLLTSRT